MSHLWRSFLLLTVLAAWVGLPAGADEVDDQETILKKKAYGDYWDRLDALSKLGGIGGAKAAEAVAKLLEDEEAAIREAAVLSLAKMGKDAAAVSVVIKTLQSGKPQAKSCAAWALGLMGGDDAVRALQAALAKGDAEARIWAARGLAFAGDKSAADALVQQVSANGPPAVRAECLLALADLGAGDHAAVLAAGKDRDAAVRAAAITAAARIDAKASGDLLKALLTDAQTEPRIAATDAIATCLGEDGLAPAVQSLADKEWPVRVAAIHALVELWTKDGVGALVARLGEEKGRLRLDISQALAEMTGKDIGYDAQAWKGWWEGAKDSFTMPKKPTRKGARQAKDGGGGTTASFFNIPIVSDRIAFVIDFSGSMKTEEERTPNDGGSHAKGADNILKIDIAIQELERCLAKLDPKVQFNVFLMCYANPAILKSNGFAKALVPASPGNLKNAVKFVDDSKKAVMAVKRGRGDMYDQVHAAMQDPDVDTIIILSDGKPSYGVYVEEDNFLHFFGRENDWRKVMVHTVLTGTKGTDAKFMDKLADMTDGIFTKK